MGVALVATLNPEVLLTRAFEEHYESVRRFACVYRNEHHDREAADEIASETFARAVRLWSRFDPDLGSLRAWLFGIAANVAREHQRSGRPAQRSRKDAK